MKARDIAPYAAAIGVVLSDWPLIETQPIRFYNGQSMCDPIMRGASNLRIMTGAEFADHMPMEQAIDILKTAFHSHAAGELTAPARHAVDAPDGSLVFTIGVDQGASQSMGFRVYQTIPDSPNDQQIVAAYDCKSGELQGIIIGDEVGTIRTGAIGGIAIDHLARTDARTMGMIGSGSQARTQIQAAAAVRELDDVKIYSPTERNRNQLAAELHQELACSVRAVSTPKQAVTDAAIVSTATRSTTPVIDIEWIPSGCHVNMLGPKFAGRSELSPAIGELVDVIVTDSFAQVAG